MIQTNEAASAADKFEPAVAANPGYSLAAACRVRGESSERTRSHVKLAGFLLDVGAIRSVREYDIVHPFKSYQAG